MKSESNYTIKHIGGGNFEVILEDGSTKIAGDNLCGMIRYTYFEDYTLPPIGWEVENSQLIEDYFPKAHKDIADGKLKPNQINK